MVNSILPVTSQTYNQIFTLISCQQLQRTILQLSLHKTLHYPTTIPATLQLIIRPFIPPNRTLSLIRVLTAVLPKLTLLLQNFHITICSIKSKLNGIDVKLELICHNLAPSCKTITVSETWPSDTDNVQDYLINGFQTPFVLNRPTYTSGVLCWVMNSTISKRRKDFALNKLGAFWLEIRHKSNKFLLCTTYQPPDLSNLL